MHTDSMTQNILGCDDKQHCEQNKRWVGGGTKWSELTKEQNTHTYTHTLTERKRVNSISQYNLHLAPALKTHQTQTHLMAALDDK